MPFYLVFVVYTIVKLLDHQIDTMVSQMIKLLLLTLMS